MNPSDFRRTKESPGFMIYCSDLLSSRQYKMMTAVERGLLFSIFNECAVNRSVPTDPAQLAKILLLEVDEVRCGLTERVRHYLDEENEEFTMPDVERYRAERNARREKQSQGGKKGMKTRWEESTKPADNSVNKVLTNQHNKVAITPRDRVRDRDESETESTGSWVKDYEKASNGS